MLTGIVLWGGRCRSRTRALRLLRTPRSGRIRARRWASRRLRLWLRLGKQSIVWGKTELFRTTDQFNPVDLALVTLGSLEETRIALWSARAVLSLYEIGPLQDVRLEFAANLDDFEPNDFGACGEPFTPNPVCGASFGVLAHGIFGIGLTGADLPPSPWEDASQIEFGGRIEFRWDRFSFAIAGII